MEILDGDHWPGACHPEEEASEPVNGDCSWLLPQSPEKNPIKDPHCAQGGAATCGISTGSVGEGQAEEDKHRHAPLLTGGNTGMPQGFQ